MANQFIDPIKAEDRNVFCGRCDKPVKGHAPYCVHCNTPFHANMHGYARLCKNNSCMRTEMAGHPHGLCRYHHEARKQRQINSAMQPNCACGSKASFGEIDCSRCRILKTQEANRFFGVSMPKQKMIVAGGRDFIDHNRMLQEFNNLVASGFMQPDCELVCGMARGADMTAYHIFRSHDNPVHVFKPDWDAEPRRAGFIRNAEMGDFADACIAFWDGQSKGTQHMIQYMQKLGKPLTIIRY